MSVFLYLDLVDILGSLICPLAGGPRMHPSSIMEHLDKTVLVVPGFGTTEPISFLYAVQSAVGNVTLRERPMFHMARTN